MILLHTWYIFELKSVSTSPTLPWTLTKTLLTLSLLHLLIHTSHIQVHTPNRNLSLSLLSSLPMLASKFNLLLIQILILMILRVVWGSCTHLRLQALSWASEIPCWTNWWRDSYQFLHKRYELCFRVIQVLYWWQVAENQTRESFADCLL